MFGLYKPIKIDSSVPSVTDTYKKVLEFHAEDKIDSDIQIHWFNDFALASQVLINNSSKTVKMFLHWKEFERIVRSEVLNKTVRHFISQMGKILIDIEGMVQDNIKTECSIGMLDGSSYSEINTESLLGMNWNKVIWDDNMSIILDRSYKWVVNYGILK